MSVRYSLPPSRATSGWDSHDAAFDDSRMARERVRSVSAGAIREDVLVRLRGTPPHRFGLCATRDLS